jgi:hypothetical protein
MVIGSAATQFSDAIFSASLAHCSFFTKIFFAALSPSMPSAY